MSSDIGAKLDRLRDVPSSDLLDVLCVRLTFSAGPDASAFARRAVQDLDGIRTTLGADEDEWTSDALARVAGTPRALIATSTPVDTEFAPEKTLCLTGFTPSKETTMACYGGLSEEEQLAGEAYIAAERERARATKDVLECSYPNYRTIEELLALIAEPNRTPCLKILADHRALFQLVWGSTNNHQAWDGGYFDHVHEITNITVLLYGPMSKARPLPFSLSDALLITYLHDIEKPWKYERLADGILHHRDSMASKADHQRFREQKLEEYGASWDRSPRSAIWPTSRARASGSITRW